MRKLRPQEVDVTTQGPASGKLKSQEFPLPRAYGPTVHTPSHLYDAGERGVEWKGCWGQGWAGSVILNRDIMECLTKKVTVKQTEVRMGDRSLPKEDHSFAKPSKLEGEDKGAGLAGAERPRWGPAGDKAELPGLGNAQEACGIRSQS